MYSSSVSVPPNLSSWCRGCCPCPRTPVTPPPLSSSDLHAPAHHWGFRPPTVQTLKPPLFASNLPVWPSQRPPLHSCHTDCRYTVRPQWTCDSECHVPSVHATLRNDSLGRQLHSHAAVALCLKCNVHVQTTGTAFRFTWHDSMVRTHGDLTFWQPNLTDDEVHNVFPMLHWCIFTKRLQQRQTY